MRRRVYLVLWGSALLACLAKLPILPGPVKLIFWVSCILVNSPGVLLIGQLVGYLWVRTIPGYLGAALISMLFWEPLIRWLERPISRSRRVFLVGGAGFALGGYSMAVERVNYQIRSFKLYIPDLPKGLEGRRVVLMADLHCGPVNRPSSLAPALKLANECRPDLILLPGDFVHYSSSYFGESAEWLSGLRPSIPGNVIMSWGNHDHWNGIEKARAAIGSVPGHILCQQRLLLQPDGSLSDEGPDGLWLCGLDDLWEGQPDLAGILRDLPARQPRLVLCHNPDVAEEQNGGRVDLMVSGHTHGGQVSLPGVGAPIVPSRYGQKYVCGWVMGPGGYPVYVTRGLGVGAVPIRLGVRPEITVFELHRNEKTGQTVLV
ncbi:metallophosphoesterase [bacterium]|nr:metallophosphoesterase [bacterium]